MEERKAVVAAIVEQGHLPAMLERFSVANPSDRDVIQRLIRESDVYLLILGSRYGATPAGMSYTEIEYQFAREYGLYILVFMLDESALREQRASLDPSSDRDREEIKSYEHLVALRNQLRKHHHLYFTSGPEFKQSVQKALSDTLERLPAQSDKLRYVRESRAAETDGLQILLTGVNAWNDWRASQPEMLPDLSKTDLHEARLQGANLRGVDLRRANLTAADLSEADLMSADLSDAVLSHSDLTGANLRGSVANGTQFLKAQLRNANFKGAMLLGANFSGADLDRADFDGATIGSTVFANNNLGNTLGLDKVIHAEPSVITLDTMLRSVRRLPDQFLKGAGLPDHFIEYARSLSGNAIAFYSCVISYSSRDQELAERLYADLQQAGIRCWFAPQSLQIGDKFQDRIEESIRIHDKVLLILSEGSVKSSWVETEVRNALEQERRRHTAVLMPIRVDDAVMDVDSAWAAQLRRTRHIGDFREWREHESYRKSVSRLIRDLATDRAVEITRRQTG